MPETEVLDFDLDFLGQQALIGIYTQIVLCFPIEDDSRTTIIETLQIGLERLSKAFPWVAGQVVKDSSGTFRIKSFERTPRLVVKDLTQEAPSMDELRKARFPFRFLGEETICPRNTIPTTEEALGPSPVLLLQANFIRGGLLLSILSQHQAMDMTGQGQVMYLLAKACRDEAFTDEDISVGNMNRLAVLPLLDDSQQPDEDIRDQIVRPPSTTSSSPPATSTWLYFSFPATSIAQLKSLATETLPPGVDFISSDDALSAFIWKAIIRARSPRLRASENATLGRAVDVRSYLGIPTTYPGLMQNMSYNTSVVSSITKEPLGVLASQFRKALNPEYLAYRTRSLSTFLARSEDKACVSFGASIDSSKDFMLSSWAKEKCYDLDFGFGKAESVRRPLFIPVEGLGYLMPKTHDGEISLAICLRDVDMERLKADEEFARYGQSVE